jgi:D-3-phosphoglycerate dehydrogenase / 2-oxoglutarate reductase
VKEATTVAILGTRFADYSIEERILGPHGVRLEGGDGGSKSIVAQAAEAIVVLAGSHARFDADVIQQLSCRGIVRYGVGVESIDLDAASRAGMWVAYVPDYGTDAVALHAVTLILAALRRLTSADAIVREGGWGFSDLAPLHIPQSLTVGILGFGRIGRRVAELLAPFGFSLLVHDAYIDPAAVRPGVVSVSLDDLLSSSDVLTLHAPGSPEERPILGRAELATLKEGAVLVNTARGSLVDEAALIDGLARGTPAMAALDVFAVEPPGDRFAEVADRVILTPHMAWYTEESEFDLRTKAAHEALRILRGEMPLHAAARPWNAA